MSTEQQAEFSCKRHRTRRKSGPVSPFPAHISHDLDWDRTRAAAMERWSLYERSVVQPCKEFRNQPISCKLCSRSLYVYTSFHLFLRNLASWYGLCLKIFYTLTVPTPLKKLNSMVYTDRATAACRRSDCQLFADRRCNVVSVTDPYGRVLGFLDRSRYFSIK
jgi:hypothetical protein